MLPRLERGADLRTREGRAVPGFDLDIGPVLRARDRGRLERLWRYILRRALATERLELCPMAGRSTGCATLGETGRWDGKSRCDWQVMRSR